MKKKKENGSKISCRYKKNNSRNSEPGYFNALATLIVFIIVFCAFLSFIFVAFGKIFFKFYFWLVFKKVQKLLNIVCCTLQMCFQIFDSLKIWIKWVES